MLLEKRSWHLGKEKKETIAFLGALCLFLATVEYLFPKPLPYMRLGLSNLPIILALDFFSFPEILLLTLLKVSGQGLINGTLVSHVFLFSFAGSFTSAITMYGLRRLAGKRVSLIGVSVSGAFTSNLIQSYLSVVFIFGSAAVVIIPSFLILGLISSIIMGIFAEQFSRRSRWLLKIKEYHG